MATAPKNRAPRNRTLRLTDNDRRRLGSQLLERAPAFDNPPTGIACGDCGEWVTALPDGCVDLLFLDPPYNLPKSFGKEKFSKRPIDDYAAWLDEFILAFLPLLKSTASIYICGEWLTSQSIFTVADRHFKIRNRITWEREKGRGAKTNWKNNSEDIWFCTVSDEYCFNVDAVKQRRPVIAPYRQADRSPKDWQEQASGNFRDTHPSNLWTDISVPFWSMPENTDHPTQKSEKLLARLVLASSNSGDFVLDPFAGSGTSCVVAKKLSRQYLGIEQEREYALLALRRLELADDNQSIQGYRDGVFWPRNMRPG